MKQKTNEASVQPNSGNDENERSSEYENFENAIRRIMKLPPEESERIRKRDGTKGKSTTDS